MNAAINTIFIIFFTTSCFTQSTITYAGCRGRFGDQLTSYIHAKWIAYRHGLTFIYQPFAYSDQLKLHEIEMSTNTPSKTTHTFYIPRNQFVHFDADDTLYVLPYFPNYPKSSTEAERSMCPFIVDWHDRTFVNELKKLIYPKNTLNLIKLSSKNINIALHIRTGGNFDKMWYKQNAKPIQSKIFSDVALPLNHPREEFYIKQLQWLLPFFDNKRIFIYIFTDDLRPEELCYAYKKIFTTPNITFACHAPDTHASECVLEDFFSMQLFDCIICPSSNYSIIAAKLGNNAITIFPTACKWHYDQLIITKTKIDIKLCELQMLVDRHLIDPSKLSYLLTVQD